MEPLLDDGGDDDDVVPWPGSRACNECHSIVSRRHNDTMIIMLAKTSHGCVFLRHVLYKG